MEVVIPILTTGFYNKEAGYEWDSEKNCHTHPNDRLLQLEEIGLQTTNF